MDIEEITQFLSEKHRLLILLGGVVCFISLFLPFWHTGGLWYNDYGGTTMGWQDIPISGTLIFWIFLILIIGLFYGYYRGYGETYPYLFLAIGVGILLLTFYAYHYKPEGFTQTSVCLILYGFFFELIGSLAITVGGYYYYKDNT